MNWKSLPWILLLLLLSFAAISQKPDEKLAVISSLQVNGKSEDIPADSILRKYVKIEITSQEDFAGQWEMAKKWLIADTAKIKKRKGVLRLPLVAGTKTFTDKLTDGEDRREFNYLGQIPFLDAYLVECLYWEDMSYVLVSKKNGATIATFSSMPYFSTDKKRIFTVTADPMENDCSLDIYNIINGAIKPRLGIRFKNWMPGNSIPAFWGQDGRIYIPVQYSDNYWKPDGTYNEEYVFVRMGTF